MLKVSRMLIQLKQEHERATVEPCLLAHERPRARWEGVFSLGTCRR
jgi:hypothetical protein